MRNDTIQAFVGIVFKTEQFQKFQSELNTK